MGGSARFTIRLEFVNTNVVLPHQLEERSSVLAAESCGMSDVAAGSLEC